MTTSSRVARFRITAMNTTSLCLGPREIDEDGNCLRFLGGRTVLSSLALTPFKQRETRPPKVVFAHLAQESFRILLPPYVEGEPGDCIVIHQGFLEVVPLRTFVETYEIIE